MCLGHRGDLVRENFMVEQTEAIAGLASVRSAQSFHTVRTGDGGLVTERVR
jgi:hypothetical protein